MSDSEAPQKRTAGDVFRQRRADLGLSQGDVAWLARVSRGTVSNLETGRVNSEARSWWDVGHALGWNMNMFRSDSPSGLFPIEMGIEPSADLPTVVVKAIVQAILALLDEDPKVARRVADRYRVLITMLEEWDPEASADEPTSSAVWRQLAEVAGAVTPHMTPPAANAVTAVFRDLGWSPEDEPHAQPQKSHHAALEAQAVIAAEHMELTQLELSRVLKQSVGEVLHSEMYGAFNRLPVRVQEVLSSGEVVDAEILSPHGSGGPAIVSLFVRPQSDPDAPLTRAERRTLIMAFEQWHAALAAAMEPHEGKADDGPR